MRFVQIGSILIAFLWSPSALAELSVGDLASKGFEIKAAVRDEKDSVLLYLQKESVVYECISRDGNHYKCHKKRTYDDY